MRLSIDAICDKGLVRDTNQDMILVGTEMLRDQAKSYEFDFVSSDAPFIVAVADGMGGCQGGECASQLVAEGMKKAIGELPGNLDSTGLKCVLGEKIKSIHSLLLTQNGVTLETSEMGSTFVGLLFYNDGIFFINIGDSRLYRFRDGILVQLSKDHSLAAVLDDPTMAKNIVINSFGGGERIFFDFEDISERTFEGDVFLLCSDGLNSEVQDEEIETILRNQDSHSLLVNHAKRKGGKDDMSVVVLKLISLCRR